MPSAELQKQFRALAANSDKAEIVGTDAIPLPSRIDALAELIKNLEDFIRDYAHEVHYETQDNVDPEDLEDYLSKITPEDEKRIELQRFRETFFNLMLPDSAKMLVCDVRDLAAASNIDYTTIWDKHLLDLGDIVDMDHIMIASNILDEANAFLNVMLFDERTNSTKISKYLDKKSREIYPEKGSAPDPS